MSLSQQDALLAKFLANINEHIDSDVKFLTSMPPHAAVEEVNKTIQAFQDWERELGDSYLRSLILHYLDELLKAVELASDVDPVLRNHLLSARCSAHADALTY
jgi:hypothetical protein